MFRIVQKGRCKFTGAALFSAFLSTVAFEGMAQEIRPLVLHWSMDRADNLTVSTPAGESDAAAAAYAMVRTEGAVFASQAPGTVPLKLYWHPGRQDNFSTATQEGENAALAAGYQFVRNEGYVYPNPQPGTVPLRLYWSGARGDNFTTASAAGERDAINAGYSFIRVEGYAPAARRDNYVVSLLGFRVMRETVDHKWEVDGKRDEIRLRADVTVVGSGGQVSQTDTKMTATLGDTNGHNGRIQAGSASNKGGIRTGDQYPNPAYIPRIETYDENAPLHVWSGELIDGETVVVISPSIWEVDDSGLIAPIHQQFANWVGSVGNKLKNSEAFKKVAGQEGTLYLELALLGADIIQTINTGTAGDRPIGLQKIGEDQFAYTPTVISLSYSSAEHALAAHAVKPDTAVIHLPFEENNELSGFYILYLQIRRE